MQELGYRMPRIVEPEHDRSGPLPREIADLRIVPVDDEHGFFDQTPHDAAPALRNVLQLAVPVELVPEQIPETDGPRAYALRDLGQRGLVDLEQPQLRAVRGQEARRHAREQIRPGRVVREPHPRGQDLRGHHRGCRFAVRRRDERRAEWQALREAVEQLGIERRQHLPRHRRSTSGADQTREPCGHSGAGDPKGQGHPNSHGRRVPRPGVVTERSDLAALTPKGDTALPARTYGENQFHLRTTAASRSDRRVKG